MLRRCNNEDVGIDLEISHRAEILHDWECLLQSDITLPMVQYSRFDQHELSSC